VYLSRSILGTYPDASGEVFVFPLSPMSGKRERHVALGFRAEGVNVQVTGAGRIRE